MSTDNPSGRVTNSDLEQATQLAQLDVVVCNHPMRYATLENLSDNTPAVARMTKGAVSKPGAAACLCQVASNHRRLHCYCAISSYLPGPQNGLAPAPPV